MSWRFDLVQMLSYTRGTKLPKFPTSQKIYLLAFCFHYIVSRLVRPLGIFEVSRGCSWDSLHLTLNEEFVDRIFLSFWLRCWEQKGYNNGTVGGKGNTAKGKKNNISAQHLTSPPICSSWRRCHNNSECELTWQKDRRYKIKDNEK